MLTTCWALTNDVERQIAALAELRAAAKQASLNYAAAAQANRSMWEGLA